MKPRDTRFRNRYSSKRIVFGTRERGIVLVKVGTFRDLRGKVQVFEGKSDLKEDLQSIERKSTRSVPDSLERYLFLRL